MKPSKWERENGFEVRRLGDFTMHVWTNGFGVWWTIGGEPARESKSPAAAKRAASSAARRMVKRMAADLGMVKL